jgi:hypothetical protein
MMRRESNKFRVGPVVWPVAHFLEVHANRLLLLPPTKGGSEEWSANASSTAEVNERNGAMTRACTLRSLRSLTTRYQ